MDPELNGIEGAMALRDFVANNRKKLGDPSLVAVGYIVNRVERTVDRLNGMWTLGDPVARFLYDISSGARASVRSR